MAAMSLEEQALHARKPIVVLVIGEYAGPPGVLSRAPPSIQFVDEIIAKIEFNAASGVVLIRVARLLLLCAYIVCQHRCESALLKDGPVADRSEDCCWNAACSGKT